MTRCFACKAARQREIVALAYRAEVLRSPASQTPQKLSNVKPENETEKLNAV